MVGIRIAGVAIALLCAHPLAAQEWQRLNDGELLTTLSGKSVAFDDRSNAYHSSGRLHETGARDLWGYWRVERGQLCHQMRGEQAWSCYRVSASWRDGLQLLRFRDDTGREQDGRIE
ncbi:hypothetical protein [Oceanomicrobium pacificus]|uniref:DUF995 domain-containing protein n=1 Tax=Oceanomicrobium pacificus TaxID=2692916 RepID=A0A6B0U475_9RHOB|nr:hypothetical protein [Oceanomicrobium pacificus]MXU65751.1 hypothetical protein [Oceanomicrobium pacificus]